MSKVRIKLKIDVTKIEKDRLYKGKKGTYLNATVLVDLDHQDQYGNNGFIAQEVGQKEREANTQGNILGNCLITWREPTEDRPSPNKVEPPEPPYVDPDTLPF